MKNEYAEKLIKIMKDNPDLKVMCKVDSDIVAEDGYSWWLGKISETFEPYIDEYSADLGEEIKFKSDNDYCDWFEEIFDVDDFSDVSDDEWEDFTKTKIDEVANWKKAIFITITME